MSEVFFDTLHSPHLTKEDFGSIIKVGLKTNPIYFMVYVNNDRRIPNQT